MPLTTAVLVGNPKPQSRTLAAARLVHRELTGREPDVLVDLATLGSEVLDPSSEAVGALVTRVGDADLVVVASPTYKATYTGLLKVFLDRFPDSRLTGVAVPLMLGAGTGHQLAPELHLAPLLRQLGGVVPVTALYVLDHEHSESSAYAEWLRGARPAITALLDRRTDHEGARP